MSLHLAQMKVFMFKCLLPKGYLSFISRGLTKFLGLRVKCMVSITVWCFSKYE
jgi:hypothetical protein